MNSLLVAIDIGNSSIGIGYFNPGGPVVQRLKTHPLRDSRDYAREMSSFMDQNHIEKKDLSCIICSVVPEHTAVLAKAAEKIAFPAPDVLVVEPGLESGLCLKVNAPEGLGADRLANAAAAYSLFRKAVAVADFGTATTITLVTHRAELIGGAIMPGLGLMNSVLGTGTSRLEEVRIEPPAAALGRDTASGILSGLFFGTAGAVERIITEVEQETGEAFSTVITGGHSSTIQAYMRRPCERRPDMIFEGLRIIYEKNRP